jgi:hypothetical protein
MDRLELDPPFETKVMQIEALMKQANPSSKLQLGSALISADGSIEFVKYFGQIIYNTLHLYQIELPDELAQTYATLKNISSTADPAVSPANFVASYHAVSEMLNGSISHMLSGSLWLLPSAVSSIHCHHELIPRGWYCSL